MTKTANKGSIAALLKKSKDKKSANTTSDENISQIALSSIKPHPDQPRKTFDEDKLSELADSIKQYGVLEPIILLPLHDGFHYLAAGERRWRASKIAGKLNIPSIIKNIAPEQLGAIQLIENIQREDIPALEEADAVYSLSQNLKSQKEVCIALGKPKDYVSKMCTVAILPEYARQAFNDEMIKDVESLNHISRIQKIEDAWARELVSIARDRGRITRKFSAAMLKRAKEQSLGPITPEEWENPSPKIEKSAVKISKPNEKEAPKTGTDRAEWDEPQPEIDLQNIPDFATTTLEPSQNVAIEIAHKKPSFIPAMPQDVVIEVSVLSLKIADGAIIDLKRISDNPGYAWVIYNGEHISVNTSDIEIKKVRLSQ